MVLSLRRSDADHQFADWVGIHERICQLLVPIRTQTLHSIQKAGRIENEIRKVRVYCGWCIGFILSVFGGNSTLHCQKAK